jgi:hypothetical protein
MGRFAMKRGHPIYAPSLVSAAAECGGFERVVIDGQYKLRQNSTDAAKAKAPSRAR